MTPTPFPMNIRKLREILDKFGNDDAHVWLNISGTLFPLCGKVKRSMLTYSLKDNPDKDYHEPAIVFQPCECTSDEEDKPDFDHFNSN